MPRSSSSASLAPTSADSGYLLYLSSSDVNGMKTPTWGGTGRHRRRQGRRPSTTTLVALLSLLLSVGAVALIVWYSRAADAGLLTLDRLVGMLQNASAAAAGRIGKMEAAAVRAAQVTTPNAEAATFDTATTLSTVSVSSTSHAQEGRLIECRGKSVDCNSSYPDGCFVTSWPKGQVSLDQACTAGSDGMIEMQTTGFYYVYSQALLSGAHDKRGVAFFRVPGENSSRPVHIRHSLWLIDRAASQPRELKGAEFVALDHLTTYVSAHVWLPSGARLGVNLTSMQGLTIRQDLEKIHFGWDPVTIGWFRISKS